MQSATPTVTSSWCGNLHQAQQVATQGVQWLFGCLPCVKGHHRIHPSNLESSDASYVTIEAKKRLRVLHVFPDTNDTSSSLKKNHFDQIDSDHCSLDSSGEDYWFMRWNRPIRPNLQRNSCNCSFRRSQIKSASGSIDSKPVDCMNSSTMSLLLERKKCIPQTIQENPNENNLINLAERMSYSILLEAVEKSSEICINLKDPNNESKKNQRNFLNNTSNDCGKICLDDVKVTVTSSETEFGGYVNPVFLSSNDSLDLIPSDDMQDDSCENRYCKSKDAFETISTDQDHFKKQLQDYNANDRNHHTLEEINALNESKMPHVNESKDNKKHRKSCLMGSKAYLKKPLLLLIHGAGSNCEVWRNLISRLVQGGYECVAPDLLGHGLSSAPDTARLYSFHSYLQDLLFIFDKFVSEGRSAVVLGHGYGCSLAAATARYRPERVVQLVLISGGGPTPLAPRTPPSVSPCLRACLEPLLMCGFKRDVVYSVCGKQMEPCSSETSAVPRHIVEHIGQGHVWPEGDAAFHRRIVAPTLLVHGMKDEHITLVQECEMERTIPRSFLEVIPEAGHWAMLETPGHLSHMILCFIDWWAPPNRTQ